MATSVTPEAVSAEPTGTDINSLMASIITDSVGAATAEPDAGTPRDEVGRFARPDGTNAATERANDPAAVPQTPTAGAPPTVGQPPVDGAVPPEGEPAPVELPDGFVAAKKIEGRELATQFTVRDADGEEIEVPDLQFTFTANGKERTEPIDKVLKFAQMGVYNEQRHQETLAVQRRADEKEGHNQQLLGALEQMHHRIERLLSDDSAYLTERAQYEQQNTPEAKAERAQAELQFVNASRSGEQFYTQIVTPGVSQIVHALPEVSRDEIEGRILYLNQRFLVQTPFGAVMDPRAHQMISQSIVTDIVPWAQQLNTERAASKETVPAPNGTGKTPPAAPAKPSIVPPSKPQNASAPADSAEVRRLQAEAQRARNLGTRGQRPARTPGTPQLRETPKPKPITNLHDAEQSALNDTFAAMGLSRPGGS